ncbi:Amino acid transporter [Entamoeba marina]
MSSWFFHDTPPSTSPTYNNLTCYSVLINYLIGTGVFGVPLAFLSSGLLLSTLMSLTFFVLCNITAFWMLESLARTCGIHSLTSEGRPITRITSLPTSVTQMGNTYFGLPGQRVVIVVLALFCIGALWAFGSIFSSTLTLLLWKYPLSSYGTCSASISDWGWFDGCHSTYLVALTLFAIMVTPMSFMDIAEQAGIQSILTVYRFFAITLMLVTCLISLVYRSGSSEDDVIDPEALFNLNGFGAAFSVISVSLACHHNIPEAVAPTTSKRKLKSVVVASLTTATILNVAVGIVCALCFGKKTISPVTSNWLDYTGCDGGFGICKDHKIKWYGYIVQISILMFPLVNLTSEYPLVSATLASNFAQLVGEESVSKTAKTLAAIPPLLLACIKADLTKIFGLTGVFGFVLVFIFPTIFQIFSKKTYRIQFGKHASGTLYSGPYSSTKLAWCVFVFSIVLFSFAVLLNLDSIFDINWLGQ